MEKGMGMPWLDEVFFFAFKDNKGGASSARDVIAVNPPADIKREPNSPIGRRTPAPAPALIHLPLHSRSNSSSIHLASSKSISLTAVDLDTASRNQPLEPFFESFLTNVNHYLFLFNESELRYRFYPNEHPSDYDTSIDIRLVIPLGAKYGKVQVEHLAAEWYAQSRLRLLAEYQDDLSLMRALTLMCLFQIDDDIEIASHFLSMRFFLG